MSCDSPIRLWSIVSCDSPIRLWSIVSCDSPYGDLRLLSIRRLTCFLFFCSVLCLRYLERLVSKHLPTAPAYLLTVLTHGAGTMETRDSIPSGRI